MKKRIAVASISGALALMAAPGSAAGHVTVQPEEAPAGGFVVENVRVPTEEQNASTTKVAVRFPPGFAEVRFQPVPGWNVRVKKSKLAKPITTEEGDRITEQVSTVTWSGGRIAPGEFQDFPISTQIPDKAGSTLTFKATQTYDNGKVVRWIGPPDAEEPAPQVKVTAAEGDTASATPAAATGSEDEGSEDDDSNGLAIAALIVGALGLLAGGAALLMRRRA